VEYLAFADDVALVASAKDSIDLERLLTSAAKVAHDWLTSVGLSLAEQKCDTTDENTQRHDHHSKRAIQQVHKIFGSPHRQQMEVHRPRYDSCHQGRKRREETDTHYAEHQRREANKNKTAEHRGTLGDAIRSSGMVRQDERNRLDRTAQGAETHMPESGFRLLHHVTRGSSSNHGHPPPPLNLLAKERKQIYDRKRNREQGQPEENILDTWQAEWDSCGNGRWKKN